MQGVVRNERSGTAIVPAFTRAPACLAQSAASLADAAPGRFALGIGSSSDVIVQRWNGVPFQDPYQRVRDVVRFLKEPTSRTYIVAYPAGRQLCRAYVGGDPARFRRLLTEQVRVGDLLAATGA